MKAPENSVNPAEAESFLFVASLANLFAHDLFCVFSLQFHISDINLVNAVLLSFLCCM